MNFEKKKEGFRFLGLDRQDIIRYFFGGNASLAIFILALIIAFLLKEAWSFLPHHHAQLKVYRKSGLEYFTFIERAYQQYKIDTGSLSRAFAAEIAHPNANNQRIISAYNATRLHAENVLGDDLLVLKDAISQRDDEYRDDSDRAVRLDGVIERLQERVEGRRDEVREKLTRGRIRELRRLSDENARKVVDAVAGLDWWKRDEAPYFEEVEERFDEVYSETYPEVKGIYDSFNFFRNKLPSELDDVWREASEHARTTRNRFETSDITPREVQGQLNVALASDSTATRQQKLGRAMEVIAEAEFFNEYARLFYLESFRQVIEDLPPIVQGLSAYESVPSDIRNAAERVFASAEGSRAGFLEALRSPDAPLDAVLRAIPEDAMSSEKRVLLYELTKLDLGVDRNLRRIADATDEFLEAFPFEEEAETLYALTDRYRAAVADIRSRGLEELEKLPAPSALKTEMAREEIEFFEEVFLRNLQELERVGEKLESWRHDKPWTYFDTAAAFFLGKQWTNNSRIQDRYGILPFFTCSMIIAIIALVIAVPISVSGAIYVNQICSFREQSFIKPAIEFIEAIPSVLLGLLGVAVVGQLLKDFSEVSWMAWFPGFPITNRLNMLLAGVLLAFMACPIIFTLAEDALNNVPTAYREGSLSLGASRLQTAFRVILPSAASGVFAAVLLGFGRVIGETMVVLIVAGNRIAIPDFTKGIGVVTEPGHTMTGIIAQAMGEAAKDSIDYWALFMVGLVLFTITLIINYIGQKILHRFENK